MFGKFINLIKTLAGWVSSVAAVVTAPGFKQSKTAKKALLALVVLAVLFASFTIYNTVQAWTSTAPAADSVVEGEHQLFALAVMSRGTVALALVFLGLFLSWLLYQIFDRTRISDHILDWGTDDSAETKASKTANTGRVFAAIVLGVFWMLAQVLR